MIDEKALAYHCAPSLVWVKDAGKTILVGKEDHTWIIVDLGSVDLELLIRQTRTFLISHARDPF